jgi:hypothetical protein
MACRGCRSQRRGVIHASVAQGEGRLARTFHGDETIAHPHVEGDGWGARRYHTLAHSESGGGRPCDYMLVEEQVKHVR